MFTNINALSMADQCRSYRRGLLNLVGDSRIPPANPCEGAISVVMAHDIVAKPALWYNTPAVNLRLAHGH